MKFLSKNLVEYEESSMQHRTVVKFLSGRFLYETKQNRFPDTAVFLPFAGFCHRREIGLEYSCRDYPAEEMLPAIILIVIFVRPYPWVVLAKIETLVIVFWINDCVLK